MIWDNASDGRNLSKLVYRHQSSIIFYVGVTDIFVWMHHMRLKYITPEVTHSGV